MYEFYITSNVLEFTKSISEMFDNRTDFSQKLEKQNQYIFQIVLHMKK